MSGSGNTKLDIAERAWRQMFDFLIATAPLRNESLSKRNLTPNDSRALNFLDQAPGHPLSTLAREWGCDPSNATAIVDRLERAGLAERKPLESDRRVKLVVLTAHGAAVKDQLMAEFRVPPPQLLSLTRVELEALDRILTKLRS